MHFSKGTTASMIATTTVVVVVAASTSHATATDEDKSSIMAAKTANKNPHAPPPFDHHHQHHHEDDDADTGILPSPPSLTTSRLRHLTTTARRRRDQDKDKPTNKTTVAAASAIRELQSTPTAWCPQGYVDCVNGYIAGTTNFIPSNSCATACIGATGPQCCAGAMACTGFTGKVCKDNSCTGDNACKEATTPQVGNSCKGENSCKQVAFGSGSTVGNMLDSCIGFSACHGVGKDGGTVGDVQGSCIGLEACQYLGEEGTVGKVKNSCTGEHSCLQLGYQGTAGYVQDSCTDHAACRNIACLLGGSIGDITSSCTGEYACEFAGAIGGSVVNLVNSCTNYRACTFLGEYGAAGSLVNSCTGSYSCDTAGKKGTVGSITNSCHFANSCDWIGCYYGVAGNVQDSCNADNARGHAGAFDGSIGNINSSCNALNACHGAGGNSVANSIISNLDNCCNTDNACKDTTEADFPGVCEATASPSSAPTATAPTTPQPTSITNAPTKSPVYVTLSFVGGCPAQISADQDHFEPGDRVSNGAIVFECKSWPNSLFCLQAAFNPPSDLDSKPEHWKQAWGVVGHCSGPLTPPTAGCPEAWTPGDMTTKYKANDQVSVIKSSSPLIQVIYKCKEWPYSWYCGHLGPLNHNGGVLGWDMVGECTGTVGPTSSPTFDPLTVVIAGCPDEYNMDAIENYVAGDKVSVVSSSSSSYKNVYVCREFPYSGYCSQSGFAPGEQHDYMAWTLLGPCDGTLSPTNAPTPFSGGASCSYTKVVTTPTPTPVVTPVGTWTAGTLYEAGDQVRIGAKKFECKPWPFYLWCRMSAYAPTLSETGLWTEAWTLAGTCPAPV